MRANLFVVFGSTVNSAVTSRGVSHLRCLAVGVERSEAGSRLFLADRRYYSTLNIDEFRQFL